MRERLHAAERLRPPRWLLPFALILNVAVFLPLLIWPEVLDLIPLPIPVTCLLFVGELAAIEAWLWIYAFEPASLRTLANDRRVLPESESLQRQITEPVGNTLMLVGLTAEILLLGLALLHRTGALTPAIAFVAICLGVLWCAIIPIIDVIKRNRLCFDPSDDEWPGYADTVVALCLFAAPPVIALVHLGHLPWWLIDEPGVVLVLFAGVAVVWISHRLRRAG